MIPDSKTLDNIKRTFHLNGERRDQEDATSVHLWVEEMRSEEESCVLYYKPQGIADPKYKNLKDEDFMLLIMNQAQGDILKKFGQEVICLDSTHGTNKYNFELTTILTIDDLHQGVPCAFFLSNRTEFQALEVLFSKVRDQVGQFKPAVFMSDMANAFYNAWTHVNGEPERRLFCSWHVDRAWRVNISKKLSTKEDQ